MPGDHDADPGVVARVDLGLHGAVHAVQAFGGETHRGGGCDGKRGREGGLDLAGLGFEAGLAGQPVDGDVHHFRQLRDGAVAGVGQQMDFGLRPALEDQGIEQRNEGIVGAVDDQGRCIVRPRKKAAPAQRLGGGQQFVHARLMVEAHVVAENVVRTERHVVDDILGEGAIHRSAVDDCGVHRARQPGHGREIAAERHPEVGDLAVADAAGFFDQAEHHIVAFPRKRDRVLGGAGNVECQHGQAEALRQGHAHVVAVHLVGIDAAAEHQHGLAAVVAGHGIEVHRQFDRRAGMRQRQDATLEFDREAGRRGEEGFDLLAQRRAPRVVGKARELGVAIGDRGQEWLARLHVLARLGGPLVRPTPRAISPHVGDLALQRQNVCARNAEGEELVKARLEHRLDIDLVGVAHDKAPRSGSLTQGICVSRLISRRRN